MEFSEGFDYEALASKYCANLMDGEGNLSGPVSVKDCLNISTLLQYYEYDTSGSHLNLPEKLAVPAVFGLTFALGLIGNGLVIYVVLRSGAMKTVTNLYLCNLSISDLLFLIFCVPFTGVTYVLPNWPFGKFMCKLVNYVMVVTMSTGVMTMVAMAIDRYFAVAQPVRSKTFRTVKRTMAVLGIIWGVNLTTLSPVALTSRLVSYYDLGGEQNFCVVWFEHHIQRRIYTMATFLGYYLCPLIIIIVAYYKMAHNLWHSVSPSFLQENTAKALECRRRVSKMVLVIISVFAVCWLPIHILHLNNDFGAATYSPLYYTFKVAAHCLCYMNGACNPVIYGFMSDNFRQCFRAAFACGKSKAAKGVFVVMDPEALPGARSGGTRSGTPGGRGSSGSSARTARSPMTLTKLTPRPPCLGDDKTRGIHELVLEDVDV